VVLLEVREKRVGYKSLCQMLYPLLCNLISTDAMGEGGYRG
jgi:hypothetical protein